jgi:hypothetical protein
MPNLVRRPRPLHSLSRSRSTQDTRTGGQANNNRSKSPILNSARSIVIALNRKRCITTAAINSSASTGKHATLMHHPAAPWSPIKARQDQVFPTSKVWEGDSNSVAEVKFRHPKIPDFLRSKLTLRSASPCRHSRGARHELSLMRHSCLAFMVIGGFPETKDPTERERVFMDSSSGSFQACG